MERMVFQVPLENEVRRANQETKAPMVLPEWWVRWGQRENLGLQANRGHLVALGFLAGREDQVKQGKRDPQAQWVSLGR